MTLWLRLAWLVTWIAVGGSSRAAGQDAAESSSAARGPTVSTSVNNAIIHQHRSGAWSVLGINATNFTDHDGDGLVSVFFPDDKSRQFERRVWVPAQSRRYTWLPVQLPPNLSYNLNHVSLSAIQLDPLSKREVFQRREGDLLKSDPLIGLSHDPIKTVTLLRKVRNFGDQEGPELDLDAFETLMTARKTANLSLEANDIPDDFLPPWSDVFQSIDQVLLTSDRITNDAAGLTALRGWVRDGGRLWIMLDRVQPETVSALLGNAVNFQILDRVPVDQFVLESQDNAGNWTQRDEADYEVPVDLVRVVTTSRDVPVRIGGWPAAIWIPMGEGEVLITTLGPRGWRPTEGREPTAALRTLAMRMFVGRDGRVDMGPFQPALQQRIGYHIPPRSFGVLILGSYCLSLLIGGVWLFRCHRADGLVWLVPLATVIAAGVLIGVGAANSTSVPPSVALGQFATVASETDEAQVHGLAAIYDNQNREIHWSGGQRGWAVPATGDGAEVRRQIWTHDDSSETQNASTRSGSVGLVAISETRALAAPMSVRAQFGASGLEGQFIGDRSGLSDPVIIALSAPSLAVALRADGGFSSRPEDVLAANEFTASSLLNDDQRRRQVLMRELFNPSDSTVFPHRASLAFWRDPFDSGIRTPEGFHVDGETLALLSLELEQTPPGSAFRIPATFLRPSSAQGAQGQSLAFNSKAGQWLTNLRMAIDTVLAFQLPSQVLPCDLTRGKLTVRISAPSREFKVSTSRGTEMSLLKSIADPSGVYDFDLAPEHLELDSLGRVLIGIVVSPTVVQQGGGGLSVPNTARSAQDNTTWQIDYVRLTLDGQTRQEDTQP